ncbi:nucleotidyltransferase [Herbaspirillum sp. ST 5-3]|uniref:SMODS domain-containing nucleotidyltransferase n=1 Tax=Oxalobacteraceae TaxID=75682 RepID=UPI001FFE7B5F|nr:nucleotidyltransferase [Herbaspirillum sp. ST 5-3]
MEFALGVGEWFATFCANLSVTNGGVISTRYRAITRRLNTDYWETNSEDTHSLYVGSYGRNTAIHGISDVDMVFQLPYYVYQQYDAYAGNGQSALLQAVRESIKRTYSVTSIGADGQVVCVPFTDGITFELLPGFLNTDGGYTFPDANGGGSWRVTNPRAEIAAMRNRNNACNGNLIPLCRMMREWKNRWSVPVSGLLIDTLAYQFIEKWEYRDRSFLYYDLMCREFFDFLALQDENQQFWRAPGSGQYVWKTGNFQYKARRCYNITTDALNYQNNNQDWSAKKQWREIFGTAFPD